MKRWSKLKKKLSELMVEGLPLQHHCTEIRRNWNNDGALTTELGVFCVRLEKRIIWEFPKQFVTYSTSYPGGGNQYSYCVSDINGLIREYIDTAKNELLSHEFRRDYFGICDILRASDRRLSIKRLEEYFTNEKRSFVNEILASRKTITQHAG